MYTTESNLCRKSKPSCRAHTIQIYLCCRGKLKSIE